MVWERKIASDKSRMRFGCGGSPLELITRFELVTSSLPKRQGGWGLFYWCPKAHCLSVFWRFLVFDKWRNFAYDSAFLSRNMNSFWSVFMRLEDVSTHGSILNWLLYIVYATRLKISSIKRKTNICQIINSISTQFQNTL